MSPDSPLHYRISGPSGPRAVLLHAVGLDHHSWDALRPHLEGECVAAAADLPGHGASAPGEYGVWEMGASVLRLLDHLGWEDAVLVGNSLGGGAALAAALQGRERVRGLVLLNPVAYRSAIPVVTRLAFLPAAEAIAGRLPLWTIRLALLSARREWRGVTAEECRASQAYLRTARGRAVFIGTLRRLFGEDLDRMAARYHEIRCPALLLHGAGDLLLRPSSAKRLAAALPDASLQLLPGCGHFPQQERPEAVAGPLLSFLRRHQPAAGEAARR